MLPENKDLRVAYIGTHNYEIGANLAKLAMKIKPKGGTVCIQSGGAAAANHNERMQGIRDTLGGKTGTTSPGEPLTGQNGWTEAQGCPLYTNDDFPLSVQQFEDIMAANPNLDAFIPTGGFPQFVPDANRAAVEPYKGKIADGSLALVVADTLPVQIDQMKEGLSAGQVGQRPFEMGYKMMMALPGDGGRRRRAGGPDLHRPRRLHAGNGRHLHREVTQPGRRAGSPAFARYQARVLQPAERIDRAFAREGRAPHQALQHRLLHPVVRPVGVDIGRHPRRVVEQVGIAERDHQRRHVVPRPVHGAVQVCRSSFIQSMKIALRVSSVSSPKR